MVKSITDQEEYEQILGEAGSKLVIIDFFATWCGPCKIMSPKFDKFSEEFKDVIFLKIDVDETALEDVVDACNIKVMPTFVFMKNGEEIARLEGNVPDQLHESIEANK